MKIQLYPRASIAIIFRAEEPLICPQKQFVIGIHVGTLCPFAQRQRRNGHLEVWNRWKFFFNHFLGNRHFISIYM